MRATRAGWTAAVGLAVLCAGGAARAQQRGPAAAPSREEMVVQLSGYERGPDEATVRAWGPGAVAALEAIGGDAGVVGAARARAVFALRLFPADAGAHAYLRTLAGDGARELWLRRSAFNALVQGFADVAEVARYLRDARPEVRDGAVWAIAGSPAASARTVLTSALREERDPTVRRTLTTFLSRPR